MLRQALTPKLSPNLFCEGGVGGFFVNYGSIIRSIKRPYYDFLILYSGRNSSWTPYQSRTATNIQFGQRLCQKLCGETEIFTGNIQSSGNFVSAVED